MEQQPSSVEGLPEGFCIRPLALTDYKDYTNLLRQLTEVGDVDETLFTSLFQNFTSHSSIYDVWVIEDAVHKKLAATSTLFIEQKVIHGGSRVGHIEEVVTDSSYRGKGIGKALVCEFFILICELFKLMNSLD